MPSPHRRRRIERELGVPVPGEILDPARWTQTALKRLPEKGPLDWPAIFGREAPLVIDLGCGNGRFTLASALLRPDHNHVGVDVLPVVIRYATRRANQRGLANVRFAVCDAERFLSEFVAPGVAAEIHGYHPQPYDDPAEFKKRLITPEFLALVHSRLAAGGKLFLQTDHPGYWKYMQTVVPAFFEFAQQPGPWPDSPKGRTRREIIALRRGLPVFRGYGTKRADLTPAAIDELVRSQPRPTFEADRRLLELDRIEQE
ncbi:MAG: methyltransferase domain-containing protein [Planctomycetia bacterium]|nr:methyltransferase domain-containing protein [Planctomycetia bacterium]